MARNAFLIVFALVLAGIAGWAILDSAPASTAPKTAGKARPVTQPGSGSAPAKAFADLPPPPAPDYSKASAWAARPDMKDYADLVPENDPLPDAQATAAVDVFYIHPTTFRSDDAWVQNIADKSVNEWTDASVIARQAAIFNGCCRVFAPRYRQAAAGAVASPEGMKAYAFAYQDVKRAFKYYLDHDNKGRPFILVGHSQGTFHLLPLLEEMIDQSPLREQLVAAYAIGIGVPLGSFGRQYKSLTACDRQDQTGCIVSWNTYGRHGDPGETVARQEQRYVERYKTEEGKELLCVNPLTFDTSMPDAPASANLGALPGVAADGPLPAVKPGLIGATCRDGTLWADIPTDPDFVLNILPGEMLHFHDMDLFFQNIRANAILRAESWLKAHPHA